METIGEIILIIMTFIFEVITLALHLLIALIIPDRRGSLKEKWRSSSLKRIEIIFSFLFIVSVFGAIIYFIFMIDRCSSENSNKATHSSIQLTEKSDYEERSIKIKISEDLKDKAVDLLKEKWKNRKNE